MNIIDQNGYCPFRLFREHCTLINTAFVKDLTRLGRDLKDIIIADNSPVAYALNQDNGFPIVSWFDNKNDTELLKVIPILEFLSYVPDVREYIKKFVSENKIQYDKVYSIIKTYNNRLKNSHLPQSMRSKLANYRRSVQMKPRNSITSMIIEKVNSHNDLNTDMNLENNYKSFNSLNKSRIAKKNKGKRRQISIAAIDFIKNDYQKINHSPSSTEIYHLKSLPCSYGVYTQMNTMRSYSSCKRVIHLVTKERSIQIKTFKEELANILQRKPKVKDNNNNNNANDGNHLKFSSQRNNK